MRSTAIDLDMTLNRPFAGQRPKRESLLARIHWPRAIGLLVAIGMWPAIIFAISRLF
jgi:hypothetical protein